MRRIRTAVIAAAVTATLTTAAATPAQATAGPVYSGYGWKAGTGIRSINPGRWLKITFASTGARSRLTPYLKPPVSQFTAVTGVKAAVTTTINSTSSSKCPAAGVIVAHLRYRPTGSKGMSFSRWCYAADGSAAGGHIVMDSEYWSTSNWFSRNPTVNEARRRNSVTHEFGHMFLRHPNKDLDKDGKVEPYECVKDAYGNRPVMCAPSGGYGGTGGGKFTSFADVKGLRQLVKNWAYR